MLLRGLVVGASADGAVTTLTSPYPIDYAEGLSFSPDNRHLAFVSVKEGLWPGATIRAHRRVSLDGQPGSDYDALGLSELVFSGDSNHLAYLVHDPGNKKHSLVLDCREAKHSGEILYGSLKFNDTSGFVYVAREGRRYLRVTQPIQ